MTPLAEGVRRTRRVDSRCAHPAPDRDDPFRSARDSGCTSAPGCSRCCCASSPGGRRARSPRSALVFNLLLLPRLGGRRLYRPVDDARGFPLGILLYPLAVLLLTCPFRLDSTSSPPPGASWRSATARRRWSDDGHDQRRSQERRAGFLRLCEFWLSRRLPWNPDKTVAGTSAFIVCGGVAGVALAWWVRPAVAPVPAWPSRSSRRSPRRIAAALVETLPVRLDDNISVPATAGAVLWLGEPDARRTRSRRRRRRSLPRCRGRSASTC